MPTAVLSQLRKPSDNLDEASAELQRYLQSHRVDLDALYALINRNDIPRWETDVAQLVRRLPLQDCSTIVSCRA